MSAPLVWINLEVSGLDPDACAILEIATLVTDPELEVIEEGPDLVIHHDDAVLDAMDASCTKDSGALVAAVRASTVSLAEAERQSLDFLARHSQPGASPLCGNAVWHDRRFIARHMPALDQFLHYRLVDVSTVKELVERWYPAVHAPKKAESRRALDDIRESLAELRFYRGAVFR